LKNADVMQGLLQLIYARKIPDKTVYQAQTKEQAADAAASMNNEFVLAFERNFKKYLAANRTVAVLVSTALAVDIPNGSPRFVNCRESVVWFLPAQDQIQAQAFQAFMQAFRVNF
jgi:hypothetical protein